MGQEPPGTQAQNYEQVQQELSHRLQFENLIASLAANFINIPTGNIDRGIDAALAAIAAFSGVDRSYIFLFSDDMQFMSNIYEWCSAGTRPCIGELQNLSLQRFPWFQERIMKLETVYVPRVADLPPEAQAEKDIFTSESIQSILNVPMVYQGKVIGFLGFDSVRQQKQWSDEIISLLEIAGEMFVNVLQRKQVEVVLHEGKRFLSDIFSSIQDGVSILDRDFTIVRVNPAMEKWYSHVLPLAGKKCYEAYHNRSAPCPTCPSRQTLETGAPAYEVVPKTGPGGKPVGWLDLYSFPLVDTGTGKVNGVIEYVRDISQRRRIEDERALLTQELLKTNKRLKALALRDPHTGLYNHRYLQEIIEAEFDRARRYAQALSVIMLDIDYFKSINDVYGHAFGDLVLKQFSKLLKKMVRRYDVPIRYGGEEFLVISAAMDLPSAIVVAQRMLNAMTLFEFGNKRHTVKLKLSIAVAAYPEDRVAKGIQLVEATEGILNRAKELGGNRVYSTFDVRKRRAQRNGHEKPSSIHALREQVEKLSKRANQGLIEAIFAFAKTIEVKDHYTGEHVENTVKYATGIARGLQLPEREVELIRQASMLHDLGKIGISEQILLKKGKLTPREFELIKKHPQIGVDIIRPIHFLHPIIPMLLYHHERWDGKGYPTGLKGEDIPIGARVVALADVYQALISDRPYRKAYAIDKAIEVISKGSSKYFDPAIVSVFLRIIRTIK